MSIPCDINPALTLGAIRDSLIAEAMQAGGAATITLRRDIVWLMIASIGEVIDRVDVLTESAAVADRLMDELAIANADRERWRTAYTAAVCRKAGRIDSPRLVGRGAEIVDLTPILARDAGRPIGPEGGAA
jgi:hypothetical protein